MRSLASLLLLSACVGPVADDDDVRPRRPRDTAGGDDTASDVDTGDDDLDTAADDTDTAGDTGGSDPAACGAYSAAHLVGAEGVYRYNDVAEAELGYSGTYTSVTASFDAATGTAVMTSESTVSGSAFRSYTSSTVGRYRCDEDGLWMVSYTLEWDYETSAGYADSGWTEATYGAYLVMPADPGVGDTWSATGTATYDGSSGAGSYPYDLGYEVVGAESRTVAAGTYSTLRVRSTASGSTSDFWIARDIGAVESEYAELERWSP